MASVTRVRRSPLNMRTTPKLRAMLEAAAASNGRSLIQEVEYRIARSFDMDRAPEGRFTLCMGSRSFTPEEYGKIEQQHGWRPSDWDSM